MRCLDIHLPTREPSHWTGGRRSASLTMRWQDSFAD